MKKYNSICVRLLAFLMIFIMIVASFVGCSKNESKTNTYRSVKGAVLPSQQISANEDYELLWDSDGKAIIFKSLKTGKYWSDILYDSFKEGSLSANGNSPISITVTNTKTLKWETVTSYSQLESNGNVVCRKIDNGLRVTYFFDNYKIAVPVDYILEKDNLTVNIDSSKILEDGTDYKLISVTVLPKFCSVKNDANNGKLFIPSGTGALMDTTENPAGVREYVGEVYGMDSARRNPDNYTDYADIKLPVFGAYGNDTGIMGIIDKCASACEITASAGNDRLGYSSVGTVFYVRGYDRFPYTYHGKYKGVTSRATEDISGDVFSVKYFPLQDENANYIGIAEKYRNYLEENFKLEKVAENSSCYSVTMLGGTNITKSFFGIPYKKLIPLTTFEQATDILENLKDKFNTLPYVRMQGYGDNGIREGSIAGGKKYPSIYGSKKDIKNFIDKYSDAKLYFDFDIVNFSKSNNGFSINSDSAKTAISYKAEHTPVDPLRNNDENNIYYTVSRDKLNDSLKFAIEKSKRYNIDYVSFSTLGYNAYSDTKYIAKSKIETDIINLINKAQSEKKSVAVSNANVYAAISADVIFDVSMDNGKWDSLDEEIPFYQMVFHSYKPMYTQAVNLEENIDAAIAKAVAYGMGVGFDVTYNYESKSDDLSEYRLYGTMYSDVVEQVETLLINSGYDKIYSQVKDLKIINYETYTNGLSKTTFEGGKTIYVNHTNATIDSPVGSLKGYEFSIE